MNAMLTVWANVYANDVDLCDDRDAALSQLADRMIEAWERGEEPPYLYSLELTPGGAQEHDLLDAATAAAEENCWPGPERTERLTLAQVL